MKIQLHKNLKHFLKVGLIVAGQISSASVLASDHDDGETATKGRNVNLTDFFVFRRDWQTGNSGDTHLLELIMNFNPRSLPGQQYYAADSARYEFHATRVGGTNPNQIRPTGKEDVAIRIYHTTPDANRQQFLTIELVKDGEVSDTANKDISGAAIKSTPIGKAPVINIVNLGGAQIKVFEGLREDPFFFDVDAFFKTRASLVAHANNPTGSDIKFTATGNDFTKDLNVISIAIEAPISLFQSRAQEKTFDFWETISVKK